MADYCVVQRHLFGNKRSGFSVGVRETLHQRITAKAVIPPIPVVEALKRVGRCRKNQNCFATGNRQKL